MISRRIEFHNGWMVCLMAALGSVVLMGASCSATQEVLFPTPSWTFESDQSFAQIGYAVACAGDVNGDGYPDVIVGAPKYDNGQEDEGRVYVFYGSANGLSATPDWIVEPDIGFINFGGAVASAGDVNGDGYDDVIIGADQFYSEQSQYFEGKAYVYLGSANGLSSTPAWTAEGNMNGAHYGWSVASAGDVNGDGFADIIVGATYYNGPVWGEGRAYVYYGSPSGPSPSADWYVQGDQPNVFLGRSVAGAGDVNHDGYDDVLIGAHMYSNGQDTEGRAYVYLGSATGLGSTPVWTAESDQQWAHFGDHVSAAGDVNGDGYADILVAASAFDRPGTRLVGKVYVFYGNATGVDPAPAWTYTGDQLWGLIGESVGFAGDINGDGFADLVVGGAEYDYQGMSDSGLAYVFYGSANGPSATPDWVLNPGQASAMYGWSVAGAGDVNGDGYQDLIIGAPVYDTSAGPNAGKAFVYYGSGPAAPTVTPTMTPSDTPSASPTDTPTSTPSATATDTPSLTPTDTPTDTPTTTPTSTLTDTPTETPSASPSTTPTTPPLRTPNLLSVEQPSWELLP